MPTPRIGSTALFAATRLHGVDADGAEEGRYGGRPRRQEQDGDECERGTQGAVLMDTAGAEDDGGEQHVEPGKDADVAAVRGLTEWTTQSAAGLFG
ncbi:MAG: hypothetical protein ABI972_16760 [Acidobacteriota bacterium]